MNRPWSRILLLSLSLLFVMSLAAPQANANSSKEFLKSCTYGVLAGTLVGAASLAFTSQPGENLRNIAKGASLGLYAGILLGVYIVYVVPAQMEAAAYPEDGEEPSQEEIQEEEALEMMDEEARINIPLIYPLISENRIEGIGVQWTVLNF